MMQDSSVQRRSRPFRLLVMAVAVLSTLAQTNPPCDICGTGGTVGTPGEAINDPLTQQPTTCGALEDQGLAGQFDALECPVVQLYVRNLNACGCSGGPTFAPAPSAPAPSAAPVVGTPSPVAATPTPSAAPVAGTSAPAAGTPAPSAAPVAGTSAPAAGTPAPSAAGTATPAPALGTPAPAAPGPPSAAPAGVPTVTSAPAPAPATPTSPTVAPAVSAPTKAPAPPPTPAQTTSLSGGAIAGIVIGALAFLGIFAGALYYDQCGGRKRQGPPAQVAEDFYDPVPPSRAPAEAPAFPPAAAAAAVGAGAGAGAAGAAAAVAASGEPESDAPSEAPSAEGESIGESQPSLAMTGGESHAEGDDSASYAYSLEAGMASTVAGAGAGADSASVATAMTGASTFATTSRKFKRAVVAPAGRLGIVIDTTLEGPVVHTVKPDSPLKGLLFVGDIIVAIDDVDTKAMSATSITSLMVKTAAQERTLTVLSNDPKR